MWTDRYQLHLWFENQLKKNYGTISNFKITHDLCSIVKSSKINEHIKHNI